MKLVRFVREKNIITAKGGYYKTSNCSTARMSCTFHLAYLLKSIMFTMI